MKLRADEQLPAGALRLLALQAWWGWPGWLEPEVLGVGAVAFGSAAVVGCGPRRAAGLLAAATGMEPWKVAATFGTGPVVLIAWGPGIRSLDALLRGLVT